MVKTVKNKSRRRTKADQVRRYVWRIRNWGWYEPDRKYRTLGDPSPLPYYREWVVGDKQVSRQEVQYLDNAIRRVGGYELVGIAVAMKRLTAGQAHMRGHLLNHRRLPASLTEIAEVLALSQAKLRWALNTLSLPEIGFCERIGWQEAQRQHADEIADSKDDAGRGDAGAEGAQTGDDGRNDEATGKEARAGPVAGGAEQNVTGTERASLPSGNAAGTGNSTGSGNGWRDGNGGGVNGTGNATGNASEPQPSPTGTGTGEVVVGQGPSPSPGHPGGEQTACRGGPCGHGEAEVTKPTGTGAGEAVAGEGRSPSPARPDSSGGDSGDGGDDEKVEVECDLSDAVVLDVELWDEVAALTEPTNWVEIRDDRKGLQFAKAVYYLLDVSGAAVSVRAVKRQVVPIANRWVAVVDALPEPGLLDYCQRSLRHAAGLAKRPPGPDAKTGLPGDRRRVWMAAAKERGAKMIQEWIGGARAVASSGRGNS